MIMERASKMKRLLPQQTLDRIGLAFEMDFYRAVTAREPDHLAALEALATAYTKSGRFEDALRVDRRLAGLLPDNPIAHYNCACSLSLLGRPDESVDALERAIGLGYDDWKQLKKDPDLDNARRCARFRSLLAH
jgi:tetratricopeptide (TPR) repeat protein